jgi:serine phosphatase RsbU (regulator of sigma subunit)/Tfp pilus assembly protein PilF
MRKLIIIFSLVLLSSTIRSQAKINEDSLNNIWNDSLLPDSSRMKALNKIGNYYMYSNPDTSRALANILLEYSSNNDNKFWNATSMNLIGNTYYLTGDLDSALHFYEKGVEVLNEIGSKVKAATLLVNIGSIYNAQGNVLKALDAYHISMKNFKNDSNKLGVVINNIAGIYFRQKDFNKAIELYTKSVGINSRLNPSNLAHGLNNIGSCLLELKEYEKSLYKFNEALSYGLEYNDKKGIGLSYQNIGLVNLELDQYEIAHDFLLKALKVFEEIGLKKNIIGCQNSFGELFYELGDYKQSNYYLIRSLKDSKELGFVNEVMESSKILYQVNKKLGLNKKALSSFELYIKFRDSVNNEKNKMGVISQEYKYEYEKKVLADSIRHQDEIVIHRAEVIAEQEEVKRQRLILYAVIVFLVLIGAFSVYLYTRFRLIRRQRNLINKQKKTVDKAFGELGAEKKKVERKNKQIITSINYAKKIQRAILPENELMKTFFSEHFVLFQPKDIVGGDFYWYRCFGDVAAIACVDCTGHGVPGGFMSMMGSLLLDKIVQNDKLTTAEILGQLNNEIIRVLKQDTGGEIQDGMDLSLCVVDKKKQELQFSGARNGIYVIENKKIKSYKADMLPAGGSFSKKSKQMKREFTSQTISLKENSWVMMYSDGYPDQLGGDSMRSMGNVKFEEILQKVVTLKKDKNDFLINEFNLWKGHFPQVDDLLVIGLRV